MDLFPVGSTATRAGNGQKFVISGIHGTISEISSQEETYIEK